MGRLTTHVLDTSAGRPAVGILVDVYWNGKLLKSVAMNADGRAGSALVEGDAFVVGTYTLVFHVGEYFENACDAGAKMFLNEVPVVFMVHDARENFHVPLLVSPWAYSTYRGS